MKKSLLTLLLVTTCSMVSAHSNECNFSTDYNIEVNEQNLLFTRNNGERIELAGEEMSINNQSVDLTEPQLKASLALQRKTRQAVKDIAEIAVEAAELGVKAVSVVATSLFGDDPQIQQDLILPIEAFSDKIKANITPTHFNAEGLELSLDKEFEREFEQAIETAMTKHAGKIIGNIIGKLFSGDSEEMNDFEFRMENLEREIETYVEANAEQLEVKAKALCADLKELESYDSILEGVQGYPKGGLFVEDRADGVKIVRRD